MFEVELFLGFPMDAHFTESLNALDPRLVALFINNGEDSAYLEKIAYQNADYVGKYVGEMSEIQSLSLLEANIYSILKKLVPHYPYETVPLILFPAEKRAVISYK